MSPKQYIILHSFLSWF